MALHIIKSAEPIAVERINICIYAPPGLGKTTLAYSADAPLLFDFDKGAHRASNRKDTVPVTSWLDAASITPEDLVPYSTVVVDTAGRALDFLTADIIRDNPKLGKGGALTLQGYGALKARFASWLKMLNTFGKDVVLVAHMDEQRNGDDIIERLDVQGGSKGEIYKSVDAMGRIFVRGKERVIDFSPRENSFGKNPAALEIIPVPDPTANNHFLADLIAEIKGKMNRLSEEQKATQAAVSTWVDAVKDFSTCDDFNTRLVEIKAAPKAAQMFFFQRAKELGLVANKATHLYEAPKEVAHASR